MTESELYGEFFMWLDGLATIVIPKVGDLDSKELRLSDLMCQGMTGHYADELFDEWARVNYPEIINRGAN